MSISHEVYECGFCDSAINDNWQSWTIRDGSKMHIECADKYDRENLSGLRCVDCGVPQEECDMRCPRGMGGFHSFAEFR
jgi:hypothetical protein